jgi:nitroimidazol reductase NimA-like FMN-containing flavoprotein (pyridoxamine 5'-phosphate oxidase superfamily)
MTEVATALSSTARTTLGRKKDRASTDRAALHAVLDEGLVCHLGLVTGGAPMVLPTGYGRDGDTLYLHGSSGAATMRAAADGPAICVTVTLIDAVIYARSVNNHSMNYRSVVIYGRPRELTERAEKLHGLRVLTDHLAPGSWEHARGVSPKELAAVTVLALDLAEASVKMRTGGVVDDESDLAAAAAWAGVLPVYTGFGEPQPDPLLPEGTATPEHVSLRRPVRRPDPA